MSFLKASLFVLLAVGFSGTSVAADKAPVRAHDEKIVDASREVDTSKLLTGVVSVKAEAGREWRYFKVGDANYKITKCTEKCREDLLKCSGGEECEIRADVDGDSIIARSVKVLGPIETKTGAQFTRVAEEALKKLKVDTQKFGKARRDPSGMVWGDIARDENGKVKFMPQRDVKRADGTVIEGAESYCKRIGASLPSREDFIRLREYMGAKAGSYEGYSPYVKGSVEEEVLPNLTDGNGSSRYFWSSWVHPDYSSLAYYFYGRYGGIYYDGRDYANLYSVRCVVAGR